MITLNIFQLTEAFVLDRHYFAAKSYREFILNTDVHDCTTIKFHLTIVRRRRPIDQSRDINLLLPEKFTAARMRTARVIELTPKEINV